MSKTEIFMENCSKQIIFQKIFAIMLLVTQCSRSIISKEIECSQTKTSNDNFLEEVFTIESFLHKCSQS